MKKILSLAKEFILIPALFSILLTLISLSLLEKVYTSQSKLIPLDKNSNSVGGGSQAVQGLLGFNLSNLSPSGLSSANYFHLILKSNTTIEKLMYMKVDEDEILIENFLNKNFEKITPLDLENAVLKFKTKNIFLDRDRISSLVTLYVNYSEPLIAQKIAQFLINETIERQRKANEEFSANRKDYLNQRIHETTQELQKSEEKLIKFRTSNKNLDSVYLIIELEKMERERRLIEGVIASLSEELEKIKINEITDNNEIQILDPPSFPQSKSSPRGSIIALFSFIILFTAKLLWRISQNEIRQFLKNIENN